MTTERNAGENQNPNRDGRSRQREPRERLPPRKTDANWRKWLTDADEKRASHRGERPGRESLVRVMSIGIVEYVLVVSRTKGLCETREEEESKLWER